MGDRSGQILLFETYNLYSCFADDLSILQKNSCLTMTYFSLQDLLRRDILYYKGRMVMDNMEVIDVEDGKEKDFNISVKNALKLRSLASDEVHILCAKKPEQKQRWLRAFTDERAYVQLDCETGNSYLF